MGILFPLNLFSQIKSLPENEYVFRDGEHAIRERMRWFMEPRIFPLGFIPDGAREAAIQHIQSMAPYKAPNSLSKNTYASAAAWTLIGPNNIGGRITGIAIDPFNTANVYFTAADGGIWKSTNGGAVFTPIADNLATMSMGSIAIDPTNTNIIYVGTGEANFSGDSYPGIGVVKSTDAGATWNLAGTKFSSNIGRMAVHPTSPNIVLAASKDGVYRSSNAGSTWTRVQTGTANDVAIHTSNPNIMLAGGSGFGVARSSDAGITWARCSTGIAYDSLGGRIALDICEKTPDVVYAVFNRPSGGSLRAVYKSTDAGLTWTRTTQTSPNFFGTQGWYDISIVVDPFNPNTVLIGGISHYRSTNGGYAWSTVSIGHVDQHAAEFDPNFPGIVYVGNDGGMYKSTNTGATFTSLNNGLSITQFYELGVAEQDHKLMYGGTQDNGSKKGTGSLNWNNATGGDGAYCVIDPKNSLYVYTEYQNGSHNRSTNGGSSFSAINTGLVGSGLWVTPVAIHPVTTEVLFTATTKQLYKTTNRGTLWFAFNGNMDSSTSIETIEICQTNPSIMLCGKTNGKVWLTTNAGASWTNVSTGLPSLSLTEVVIDPTNTDVFYATFSGYSSKHVWRTTNAGALWTDITNNLPNIPTNCIAVNPYIPSTLYVGTDFGCYISENSGSSWQALNTGLPLSVVVDLDLHKSSGLLRAATHGRSIYELAIALPVELTSFSGQMQDDHVQLEWRTSSETNNRGFVIERSFGKSSDWTEIGFVDGHGSTNETQLYAFQDDLFNVPDQVSEIAYRLRQIDFDGSYEYSHVVMISVTKTLNTQFLLDQNYPNPFGVASRSGNPVTTIRYAHVTDAEIKLFITDALGKEVATLFDGFQRAGEYIAHFNASNLPTGNYFYHLISVGKRLTRKMVFMK